MTLRFEIDFDGKEILSVFSVRGSASGSSLMDLNADVRPSMLVLEVDGTPQITVICICFKPYEHIEPAEVILYHTMVSSRLSSGSPVVVSSECLFKFMAEASELPDLFFCIPLPPGEQQCVAHKLYINPISVKAFSTDDFKQFSKIIAICNDIQIFRIEGRIASVDCAKQGFKREVRVAGRILINILQSSVFAKS